MGFVAGLGELIGYALRLVSGYLADRTGRYWAMTLLGYGLNLLAVPLLALAGRWEFAAALMIAERVGKAIRTPARDAMLSYATKEVGHGWGFGLHEAMDQAGAVLGPLTVAAVLAFRGGYRLGFGVLLVPALWRWVCSRPHGELYPRPARPRDDFGARRRGDLPARLLVVLGRRGADRRRVCRLPAHRLSFRQAYIVPAGWIPVFYAFAMGVDALAALIFGPSSTAWGSPILIVAALLSSLFAPLVFFGGFYPALAGMALWGVGMGAAGIDPAGRHRGMVPPERRGSAYGLFNTGYGIAWFLGSALMGYLYDSSLQGLVWFSVIVQLAAIPLFVLVANARRPEADG